MGEVINLRQARKARARAEKEAAAAENRTRFGRTKGDRNAAEIRAQREDRHVEGHRLAPGTPPDPRRPGEPDGA